MLRFIKLNQKKIVFFIKIISINELVGTFATVTTGGKEIIPDKIIAIDTSNNRLGVNTIDPSYEIHIATGTLSTEHIELSGNLIGTIDISNLNTTFTNKNIIKFIIPDTSYDILPNQIYHDNGTLKIKLSV